MSKLMSIACFAAAGTFALALAAHARAGGGWVLKWSPDPALDGLAAFEGAEAPNRMPGGSHPGVEHIRAVAEPGEYQFDLHHDEDAIDNDTATDSSETQRAEVKGMNTSSGPLIMRRGDRWRFRWSIFIPDTLVATDRFTHVWQLKAVDIDGIRHPIVTASIHRHGGVRSFELRIADDSDDDAHLSPVALTSIAGRWVDMDVDVTLDEGSAGRVRWVLRRGTTTLVDQELSGIDTWRAGDAGQELADDRARPKWGLYRYVGPDLSRSDRAALRSTQLRIANLEVSRWE